MKKQSLQLGLIVLGVILVDQLTKVWVKLSYPLGHEIRWIGNWLKLHYVENPGAAFGLSLSGFFRSMEGEAAEVAPRIILTLLSLGIAVLVSLYLFRAIREDVRLLPPAGLIIGGAFGNLIDRIFYGVLFPERNAYEGGWFQGQVVDFIYVDIWQGILPEWVPFIGGEYIALWPVFNIADSCISIGVIWLLFLTLRRRSSDTKTGV
ncbi:MAG: signal peptidase II [Bacteroidia bacterium]|nr:signal peptidase II [Bacteroidia bacterium]MDW8014484.1 signal peptidase II [Bacteroidia bacterium]